MNGLYLMFNYVCVLVFVFKIMRINFFEDKELGYFLVCYILKRVFLVFV